MIIRTYACPECGHRTKVELRSDQWDAGPPECQLCPALTHQEFTPPAIGGSARSRATALALDIAEKDYGIADIQTTGREGSVPEVRFRDQSSSPSSWGAQGAALSQAMALGRENRLRHGSGLDVLQSALRSGAQPDLIEASKRRSARGW